jgi:sugar/nucleoside kinase (ribokinase family)
MRGLNPMSDVDVMMIGHFARDQNIVDGVGAVEPGGAVYFGSVALRRLGLRVAVVTRLHPDDLGMLEALRAKGVQVYATPAPETSGIANYYDSADMERRVCKPLGFAGPFRPGEIPELAARIYAVVPIIAGEVDLVVLQVLSERGPVALDVQGFVRVREETSAGPALIFRPWEEKAQGLALVTYLKVDRAEAELLTGETDLQAAARSLAALGPREVVLTESSGVTVLADGAFHRAPFTSRHLSGRTGRGDTCFASYLGMRLQAPPDYAARVAAAVTSLKQEEPGPWRGSLAEVESLVGRPTESGV